MAVYPSPLDGELTLYLLGPGFGESIVLCFPGGETVVVDCCQCGETGTLELLQDLGRTHVDLLLLTHPDLDHVNGLDTLLTWLCAGGRLKEVWTWPHLSLLRDLLRVWGCNRPGVQALEAAFSQLDSLAKQNRCLEVTINNRDFTVPCGALLTVLAPVPADVNASRKYMKSIVERDASGTPKLAVPFVERLLGQRDPGDHPNMISIAAAIQWGRWKLLLGGDVESKRRRWQGWRGVVDELERQGRLDSIRDIDVVKVSHHGSINGMYERAWAHHTAGRTKVQAALVTPFTPSQLPGVEGLRRLMERADRLAVPTGACHSNAVAAGWTATAPQPTGADIVVVRLSAAGALAIEGRGQAQIFTS